ncbi:Membrane carboxypeptidase (penicillin-binding protein) [Sanguibacter gelidistatuariae]|uniref:Membrane carboxypeptidase (Penicillin-binding protein) n=1 Tax=Sanguibacter gelidistatuariae TaxID=1814289 RepID=A0A1G6UBV3_9MICO|nr:transglycosylase domain-containing protein [Sanguibacter gelidistatuariae]SDD38186.1 Membrane carboxypeptidase (penicillin-binding protein) [Sanguibacter gelidistatuariae]
MENSALGEDTPLSSGAPATRSRHSVNVFQAMALLLTFVMLAGVGGVLTAGLVIPVAAGASAVAKGTTQAFYDLPTDLEPGALAEASYIYANDGTTLLATFYVENREVVPLASISPYLQNAVIATEDRRFFSHGGIDPKGMTRAAVMNQIKKGTGQQGASTLTQQYVKNVLIEKANSAGDKAGVAEAQESTMDRKLREAKLAISLEKRMSKEDILAGYLNIAQFGLNVNGVEAAAKRYFGKSAADLSIVEAATIAGITQRPTAFDPTNDPAASERRRNVVLANMYKEGYITKEEYETARATPLVDTLNVQPINRGCVAAAGAAYFCDYVTKVILQDPAFGDTETARRDLLERGGLTIVTTIDLGKQAVADTELRTAVPVDDPNGIANAMVSVEPGTGKILAMAQNRDFSTAEPAPAGSTFVNYNTDAKHGGSNGFQAGSTFKAFVLAEWLHSGHTLRETVNASQQTWTAANFTGTPKSCMNLAGTDPWTPRNSDGVGKGMRTVLQATALSINTAFASMESKLSLCNIAEMADAVGFRAANGAPVETVMSMVLGTQYTTPLSMASAYATFAAGGTYCDPVAIASVTNADGSDHAVPQANCKPVLDTATVNAVNYALQQVLSPQGGAKASVLASHTAAGKTGTTNDNGSAWFVGYTPALSTAYWMGNPNRKVPMQHITIAGKPYSYVYGSSIAAPTWKRYMDTVLEGTPDIGFPDIAEAQLGKLPVIVPPVDPNATTAPPADPAAPPADPAAPPADASGQGNRGNHGNNN